MKREPAEILRDALALPDEARAALAAQLIRSLDHEVDEDAEAEWDREILRRLREIDARAVELVPWSEARRRILGE